MVLLKKTVLLNTSMTSILSNLKAVLLHCLIVCSLLIVQTTTSFAEDDIFTYTWIPEHADPSYHLPFENDFYTHGAAGQIQSLEMEYNSTQSLLSVDLTLASATAPAELPKLISITTRKAAPDGFLSRITAPDKGRFATLYFDVTSAATPKLSVYSFTGNADITYEDLSFYGRIVPSGVCPVGASCHVVRGDMYVLPEQVCTTEGAGNTCGDFVVSSSYTDNGDGSARYVFTIRTEAINAHVPAPYNLPAPGTNWEGMQFNWEVGYLISAYGYSNVQTTYNADGFITDVDFDPIDDIPPGDPSLCYSSDRTCPAGYQTLICGHDMKTVQPAYCEVLEADSGELMIGESFTAAFRALSKGGNDLTVFYTGAPASMQFTPVDGTTEFADPQNRFGQKEHPDYDIFYKQAPIPNEQQASLEYTATEEDSGMSFTVNVSFLESRTGREFLCPVGFSVIDVPECSDVDILDTQFTLDSNSAAQARLVKRIARQYVNRARGTEFERAARAYRRQVVQRASELNELNWTLIWSIPAVLTQCDPNPLCIQVSTVSSLSGYTANALELRNLVRQTNRRMKRQLGKVSRRLIRQANALFEQSQSDAGVVPQSYDVCSDPSVPPAATF